MRIILDTNVVISALLWSGTPYRLLETIRHHGDLKLFTSIVLVEELTEVLGRRVWAKRIALLNRSIEQIIADYVGSVDLVVPLATPHVVAEDADDDHVIAAAIAAEADIIASGDNHLLKLHTHRGIHILPPADLLALIRR